MRYHFFIETYETEILKTISIWGQFHDCELQTRPNQVDSRGRSVLEQMIHQCVSENIWFIKMFQIDVQARPVPELESILDFIKEYSRNAMDRLEQIKQKPDSWWEEKTDFFNVKRARTWIMTRRIAHSAHHRGQLMAMLRMLGKPVYSNYGPTADTGGLMANNAPTIYCWTSIDQVIHSLENNIPKPELPGPGSQPCTERPVH